MKTLLSHDSGCWPLGRRSLSITHLRPCPDPRVFHCHILTHVENDEGMFGMVTALVVERSGS